MRKNLMALCTLLAASAMLLASCQDAEEQTVNEPVDMTTRATTFENFARVVYVEVNDVNPLNAGEYLLPGGVPFFTHVILFASNIRGRCQWKREQLQQSELRRHPGKSRQVHCPVAG